jgi:glutamine amidotransferase
MGNLGSLENMIRRVGGSTEIASSKTDISKAKKLILPGVGFFAHAVQELKRRDIWETINQKVINEHIPILCICLGAQLATEYSEEGEMNGFGWVKGKTVRFDYDINLRIPHMGWNEVELQKPSRLFTDMYEDARFYFVHSYYMMCENAEEVLTTTIYGKKFISSIEKENIFAVQFHPEKSHKYGMKLFENFLKIE